MKRIMEVLKRELTYVYKLVVGFVLIQYKNIKVYMNSENRVEFEVFKKKMTNAPFLTPGIDLTDVAYDRILRFFKQEFDIEDIFEWLYTKGVRCYSLDKNYDYKLLKQFDGSFIPSVDRLVVKKANGSLFVHEAFHAIQKHKYGRFGFMDIMRNLRASIFLNVWQDPSFYYALDFEVEAYDVQEKYLKFVDLDMRKSRAMRKLAEKISK